MILGFQSLRVQGFGESFILATRTCAALVKPGVWILPKKKERDFLHTWQALVKQA